MGRTVDRYAVRGYWGRPGTELQRSAPRGWRRENVVWLERQDVYHGLGLPLGAAWVASELAALRTETIVRARAYDLAAGELAAAGRVQAGLLPEALPHVPGWEVAAALEPARQTWGDFYDFIPLPGGRWAIVIADVADKGAGAALYMALTRTLLRSAAELYPDEPDRVLETVNARILGETHSETFVTVLYVVLEPETGRLTYANGGHNPGCVFRPDRAYRMPPTGAALGWLPDARWETRSELLAAGDTLLLYTDGATDAQAADGSAFGLDRLLSTAQAHLGRPCAEIQAAVLHDIHGFVGSAPRFDDLTLVVLQRS